MKRVLIFHAVCREDTLERMPYNFGNRKFLREKEEEMKRDGEKKEERKRSNKKIIYMHKQLKVNGKHFKQRNHLFQFLQWT